MDAGFRFRATVQDTLAQPQLIDGALYGQARLPYSSKLRYLYHQQPSDFVQEYPPQQQVLVHHQPCLLAQA